MAAELAVEALVPLHPGRVSRIPGALPPAPSWPLQARREQTALPGDKPGGAPCGSDFHVDPSFS